MKKLFYSGCFFLVVIILSTCFSPWRGEEGNLTIYWGKSENSRLVELWDMGTFYYRIILKGPGGIIEEEIYGKPGASFSLIPGTWSVIVKGGEYISGASLTDPLRFNLRVMGIEQIEVKTGSKTSETVNMYTAYEAFNWGDIYSGIAAYQGSSNPSNREVIIFINNSKSFPAHTWPLPIDYPVILVAEKPVTITRQPGFSDEFFNVITSTGRLTLGLPGMIGTLTLDGGYSANPLITISGSASLIMNNGVTLQNNENNMGDGGGIKVQSGSFTMNGGSIIGNTALAQDLGAGSPNGTQGGGVYVDSTGAFTMNGGTISNNKAIGWDTAGNPSYNYCAGGGVYAFGAFNQRGGTISGNFPDNVWP